MKSEKELEKEFQSDLIEELEKALPGAWIFKNEWKQGIPDLTILYKDHWALLECKAYEKAIHQPNQDYYVEQANQMSFARFIFPENKQEVLNELYQTLGVKGQACNP